MDHIKIVVKTTGTRNFIDFISLLFLLMIVISSCEINDPVGDISTPGHITANVYWDIPVTNVQAGNEVEFYAEYWSTEGEITDLGVWYDVEKTQKITLTYPGNGFSLTIDSAEQARAFLEVKTFEHSTENYDPEKKSYAFNGNFPVSYTLSSTEYNNPAVFNADQFNQLIPAYVRDRFVDDLIPQLNYPELRNLLVVNRQVVEPAAFDAYFVTDTIGDEVTYTLREEAVQSINTHLMDLPFGDLIYNSNRQFYAVEYTQGFQLNARLRIVNDNQVENFSETKIITVL